MSEQSNIYDRCRKRLTQKPDLKNLGPVILAESLFEFVGFQGGFQVPVFIACWFSK